MASTTAKLAFTFNPSSSHSARPITHNFSSPKTLISIPPSLHHSFPNLKFIPKSIDVSQEDKPVSSEVPISDFTEPDSDFSLTEQNKPGRPEEKFVVLNTGVHECRSCGYLYNESKGDPSFPIPPGLPYDKLPEDWRCPTCGAAQSFFVSKSVEIAGFAENQQYGLGGNTLTSGQKALLIYGSLLLAFALFLSGYFIQ